MPTWTVQFLLNYLILKFSLLFFFILPQHKNLFVLICYWLKYLCLKCQFCFNLSFSIIKQKLNHARNVLNNFSVEHPIRIGTTMIGPIVAAKPKPPEWWASSSWCYKKRIRLSLNSVRRKFKMLSVRYMNWTQYLK